MKKILLFSILLFSFLIGLSQARPVVAVPRSSPNNTVQDPALYVIYNFGLPRYNDTTAANAARGADSSGTLIYTRAGNKIYKRVPNPKHWEEIGGLVTPIGTNFKIGVNGTNNVKGLIPGLYTTMDSATAGSIKIGVDTAGLFSAVHNTSTLQKIFDLENARARMNKPDTIDLGIYPFYIGNTKFQPSPPNRFPLASAKLDEGTVTINMQNYAELGLVVKTADFGTTGNEFWNLYETGVNPPGSVSGYQAAAAYVSAGCVNSTNAVQVFIASGFKGNVAGLDSAAGLYYYGKGINIASNSGNGYIRFGGGFTTNEYARFDRVTGYFGIKTATPAYPLDVNGDGRISGISFNRATGFGAPQIITSEYLTIANTGSGTEGLTIFESRSTDKPVEIRTTGGNGGSMANGVGVINGFNFDGPLGQRQALYIITSGFNAQIVAKAGPIVLRPGTNYARFRDLTQFTNDSVRVELNQAMTGRFYVSGKSTFTDSTNIFTRLGSNTDSVLVKSAGGIVNAISSTGFIKNQFASAQTTANYWISGHARIDDYLQISTAGRFVADAGGDMSLTTSASSVNGGTLRLRDIKFFTDVFPYNSLSTTARISSPENDMINIHTGTSGTVIIESPVINFGGGAATPILTVGGYYPLHIRGNDGPPSTYDYLDLQNNNDAGLSVEATKVRLTFSTNRQNGSAIVHTVNAGTQQKFATVGMDVIDYTQTTYKGDLLFETVNAAVASGTPVEYMRLKYDGRLYLLAYASASAAPTTSGTKHMLTVDANGLVSHEPIPAGGGGSSDHAALSNLSWTVSGHTATANNIAGFNGSGAASLYTTTGTGTVLALATSPTFVTPLLGTPTSANLINATGYVWNNIASPTADQTLTFGAGFSSTWTNSNTTEDLLTVNSSTVTTSTTISLSLTGTAQATGSRGIKVIRSGANAATGQTIIGNEIGVLNTNVTSGTNIGSLFYASGATTANFAVFTGTNGADGRMNVNNATNVASQVIVVKSLTNAAGDGIIVRSNDETTSSVTYGSQTITASGALILSSSASGVEIATRLYIGTSGTPATASLELLAGTGSLAPMRWNSGALTTGGNIRVGQMEFLTDKWYGTITTGTAQKEFTMNDIALTSGRVTYVTTNGRLTNDASFTYAVATGLNINTSSTGSVLTIGGAITPGVGSSSFVTTLGGGVVEPGSGTNAILGGVGIFAPIFTAGGAAVTNAQTLYVSGNTNAAGAVNAAIWAVGTLRLGQNTIAAGIINMEGLTSGTVSIVVPAVAGTPTITMPTVTGTLVQYAESSITSSATPTPAGNARENFFNITALVVNATFAAPTGAYTDHNSLTIRITDSGGPHSLTWNGIYRGGVDIALPSATTAGTTMYLNFLRNDFANTWDIVGLSNGY